MLKAQIHHIIPRSILPLPLSLPIAASRSAAPCHSHRWSRCHSDRWWSNSFGGFRKADAGRGDAYALHPCLCSVSCSMRTSDGTHNGGGEPWLPRSAAPLSLQSASQPGNTALMDCPLSCREVKSPWPMADAPLSPQVLFFASTARPCSWRLTFSAHSHFFHHLVSPALRGGAVLPPPRESSSEGGGGSSTTL